MPLSLRIRHALGESNTQLDDRAVDEPHYIGRGKAASVRVPSMAVSSMHAALFVHDGRWAVQDAGSRAGTFVNGMRSSQPVLLNQGDIIALGREAGSATVTVESMTAPIESFDVAPAPPRAPRPTPAPVAPRTAPAVESETIDAHVDEDNIFAPTGPALYDASQVRPRAVRKPNQAAKWLVGTFMALVVLGALGTAAFFLVRQIKAAKVAPVAPAPPAIAPDRDEGSKPKLFVINSPAAPPVMPKPKVTPKPPAGNPDIPDSVPLDNHPDVAVDAGPAPDPLAGPSADPLRDDPAWRGVIDAANGAQPEVALAKFAEFKRSHTASPLLAELDLKIENSLDELWWRRIGQIFDRRKNIADEIASLKAERAAAGSEQKAVIDRQTQSLQSDDRSLVNELTADMGFKDAAPVPTDDDAELSAARARRDAKLFATWKERVLGSITRRRGTLPWR